MLSCYYSLVHGVVVRSIIFRSRVARLIRDYYRYTVFVAPARIAYSNSGVILPWSEFNYSTRCKILDAAIHRHRCVRCWRYRFRGSECSQNIQLMCCRFRYRGANADANETKETKRDKIGTFVIYPVDPGFCRIVNIRSSSLQVSYGWHATRL